MNRRTVDPIYVDSRQVVLPRRRRGVAARLERRAAEFGFRWALRHPPKPRPFRRPGYFARLEAADWCLLVYAAALLAANIAGWLRGCGDVPW